MEIEQNEAINISDFQQNQEKTSQKKKQKTKSEKIPEQQSEELKYWKNQLTYYENELLQILNDGLPMYIYSENIFLADHQILEGQDFDKFIAPIIDQKNCENILQSIQLVKNKLNLDFLNDNQIQTEIWKVANRHNYLEKVKSIQVEPYLSKFYIWELRNPDILSTSNVSLIDYGNQKTLRIHLQKTIEKLDNLIIKIKTSSNEDIVKINKALDEYKKHVQTTPKLKKLKEIKIKDIQIGEVQKSVKKLKIDNQIDIIPPIYDLNQDEQIKIKPSKNPQAKAIKQQQGFIFQLEKQIENLESNKESQELKEKQNKSQNSLFKFFSKQQQKTLVPQKNDQILKTKDIISQINSLTEVSITNLLYELKNQQKLQFKSLSFYYFHDSIYQLKQKQVSYMISPLNPIQKIQGIQYEIDSDDEVELNEAEDCENISEMEEESDQESSDDGFIVPDGHLSGDELSQSENKLVKQSISNKQTYQQFYLDFRQYVEGKDRTMDEQVENFKIINITNQGLNFYQALPISTQKEKKEQPQVQKEPDTFENQQAINDFINLVHGSFSSKIIIIDEFIQLQYVIISYPKCSKARAQKFLSDNSKKLKLESDKRVNFNIKERFYINIEFLEQNQFPYDQANLIATKKKEDYLQKQKDHKILMKQMQENEKQMAIKLMNAQESEIISNFSENSNTMKQRSLDDFLKKK